MTPWCHVTKPCDSFDHVTLVCHLIRNTECSDHCFVKACLIQNVTRNRHQRNHVINETDFVAGDDVMMTSQSNHPRKFEKKRPNIIYTKRRDRDSRGIICKDYQVTHESSRDNNHMCRRLDRRRGHQ